MDFKEGTVKQYKKGTILLQEGEKARYSYQVLRGCLKSYVIDKNGKEHILQFAPENWLIGDMDSFTNGVPAVVTIETIEDSEVVLIPKLPKNEAEILSKEQLSEFIEKLKNRYIATNNRLIRLLSATAEERYLDFIDIYPLLHQRLPLKLIASYLGITPEFLSLIRKNLGEKSKK